MKTLIIAIITLISFTATAKEQCHEQQSESSEEVVYAVNKNMPRYLKGAKITITLADGSTSTVPAEKFMIVPRKQYTKLGENKTVNKKVSCTKSSDKKNIVMLEAREDVTDVESKTEKVNGGIKASTKANQAIVPGLNYYRREVLDTPIGVGLGLDTNGTVKGMIGIDF